MPHQPRIARNPREGPGRPRRRPSFEDAYDVHTGLEKLAGRIEQEWPGARHERPSSSAEARRLDERSNVLGRHHPGQGPPWERDRAARATRGQDDLLGTERARYPASTPEDLPFFRN